jgi:hypothetical protein
VVLVGSCIDPNPVVPPPCCAGRAAESPVAAVKPLDLLTLLSAAVAASEFARLVTSLLTFCPPVLLFFHLGR